MGRPLNCPYATSAAIKRKLSIGIGASPPRATKLHTKDKARRIAANIAKLPVFICCDAISFDKSRNGFGNDNTHYPYPYRRHHDRAVTGGWLASLHDGKRGTCQVSQGA